MDAAEMFFAKVIDEFGVEEGDLVRIPMKQCELARRRGVAASTVAVYLRALGPRVVQRRPEIILHRANVQPAPSARTAIEEPPPSADALLDAYRLVLADLLQTNRSAGSARGPRAERADSSDIEDGRTDKARRRPCFDANPREPARGFFAEWTNAELEEVLAPLDRAVKGAGLRSRNNPAALACALRGYPLPAIASAVHTLVGLTGASGLRSPFGLLFRWAADGTLTSYLPVEPPPPPDPVTAQAGGKEDQDSPVDEGVCRAVLALTDTDRAGLDRYIDLVEGPRRLHTATLDHSFRVAHFAAWSANRVDEAPR